MESVSDIIYFKDYSTLFATNPKTLQVIKINTENDQTQVIGTAFKGEYPGRTLRKSPQGNKLLMLTRRFKISVFQLKNNGKMSRAGKILLGRDSSIVDFHSVSENKVLIVTNTTVFLYLYDKRNFELLSMVEMKQKLGENEHISSFIYSEKIQKVFVAFFDKKYIFGTRICTFSLEQGNRVCLNTIVNLGQGCNSGVIMKMNLEEFEESKKKKKSNSQARLYCFEATGDCRLRIYKFGSSGLKEIEAGNDYNCGPCYASEVVKGNLVSVGVNGQLRILI